MRSFLSATFFRFEYFTLVSAAWNSSFFRQNRRTLSLRWSVVRPPMRLSRLVLEWLERTRGGLVPPSGGVRVGPVGEVVLPGEAAGEERSEGFEGRWVLAVSTISYLHSTSLIRSPSSLS